MSRLLTLTVAACSLLGACRSEEADNGPPPSIARDEGADAAVRWFETIDLGLLAHDDADHGAAERLFDRAFASGGGPVANRIAYLLINSRKDPAKGAIWYRRSAEAGDLQGMRYHARGLSEGIGQPRDETESLRWKRRAATHGKSNGYDFLTLAHAYDGGLGEKRNPEAALAAVRIAKRKWIDDSDTDTPERIEALEGRLMQELSRPAL
ncbi:MAG TPA: hypothetical protein VF688_04160 [Allosphingosinicella sp.]|jgi:TPR repeat protein